MSDWVTPDDPQAALKSKSANIAKGVAEAVRWFNESGFDSSLMEEFFGLETEAAYAIAVSLRQRVLPDGVDGEYEQKLSDIDDELLDFITTSTVLITARVMKRLLGDEG